MKSQKTVKISLLSISIILGVLSYLLFFVNILPMFFANMENIEKNILAILIIIFAHYSLLTIIFNVDQKIERILLFVLYLVVLIFGLLRPDQQNFGETGSFAWNPLGFVADIQNDNLSLIIMFINIAILIPMYFLLSYATRLKSFLSKLIVFELFIVAIELLQAKLLLGIFDLSDLLLYNIGFFLGAIIAAPFLLVLRKRKNKAFQINKTELEDNL
ncbi:hypothetical protein KZO01_07570 [Kurthia zopfii]|uniref:VanZ like family n=1 Tax=Kurthia zopfii TaxID=1650 RepID=A0A2U3ACX4_9BACL|nr:VanZ family protein [Kurthia zopfii]PWI22382.1 hypothetical protein DF281_07265 [Kurthia zopfii]TDR38489.1 VanZ like protein [Kurthia zopfii]STX08579.1 VanZ like family [Kurthia zopfii]VEI05212.1 VanZ like family [Kurthia zopfii]GEK30448.1 hypothetical protein KZO01_07570 [Kurthia zopfii]